MYHKDIWIKAYCKLSKNPGNLTPGTDGTTIDGTGLHTIEKLIEELKTKKFRFKPVRRIYIPKTKGKKLRPLGIPNFREKLVTETMRMILEAIYEPIFAEQSHGFWPNRSCHTAIDNIRRRWRGVNFWIEGDIENCFDSFSHNKLLEIMSAKIECKNFLRLTHNLLKCGIIENWNYRETFSGVP